MESGTAILLLLAIMLLILAIIYLLYKFLSRQPNRRPERGRPLLPTTSRYASVPDSQRIYAFAADKPMSPHEGIEHHVAVEIIESGKNHIIFTDGSENDHKCGFGVYAGLGSFLNCSTILLDGEMSSDIAELQGIIQPLNKLRMKGRSQDTVFIGTDSLFTIMGLEWILKGLPRDFSPKRLTNQKTKELEKPSFMDEAVDFYHQHYDYLELIRSLATFFKAVYLFHIPAHQGIAQNEMADVLAKLSIFKNRKNKNRENVNQTLSIVCYLNRQQLKSTMDLNTDVRYCDISGGSQNFELSLCAKNALDILRQPMKQSYNLEEAVRVRRNPSLTMETVIWKKMEIGKILDTEKLMYHIKRRDKITWGELLK